VRAAAWPARTRPAARLTTHTRALTPAPSRPVAVEHPDLGGRSGGGSRRASRDGGSTSLAGAALGGGAERLDTVEEGNSRASSQAQISLHTARAQLDSPFAPFACSQAQRGGEEEEEEEQPGGGGGMPRSRSAPATSSSGASSSGGADADVPLVAVHVRGASLARLDSEAERKLDMLARIRLDLEASASEPGGGAGSGGGAAAAAPLHTAASLLAGTPSALLDAVLKPFRRSTNRVLPAEAAAPGSPPAGPGAPAEEEDDEEDMCGVCLDVDVNALMRPCRHRICVTCAKDLCRRYTVATALCPYCRATISDFEYARAS
jgi:hypothetical protein